MAMVVDSINGRVENYLVRLAKPTKVEKRINNGVTKHENLELIDNAIVIDYDDVDNFVKLGDVIVVHASYGVVFVPR